MSVAVLTLGLSPPIATEFLLGLLEHGVKCDRVIAVITKGSSPSFQALKIAFYWSSRVGDLFPELSERLLLRDLSYVNLFPKELTMNDIAKPEDCQTFRVLFNSALRDAIKWVRGDISEVYVCVAGGRKTMPIDATLIAIAENIRNIYHVIAPTIPGIAKEFPGIVSGSINKIKIDDEALSREDLLRNLSKYAEEPGEAEESIIKYSINLCFPPKNLDFYLVKIPIPHLSSEERKRFRGEILP